MTKMVDSVTPAAIPVGTPVVAGYADGPYGPGDVFHSGWNASSWNDFPGSILVTITVNGMAGSRVYDIESGDGTPAQGAAWCKREIAAGRRPCLYAAEWSWLNQVDPALHAVGLLRGRDVDGWVASIGPAVIPAGFVAIQYAQNVAGLGGHSIDLSVTNGVWPAKTVPPSGGKVLAAPIVTAISRPQGDGYWEIARDGGVFAFGAAVFHGGLGGKPLTRPIVAAAVSSTGNGYWLFASDGGVFAYGDAGFHGSVPGDGIGPAPEQLYPI